MTRFVLLAILLTAAPAAAAPRDELLRVAPPDAALVLVVQNARGHVRGVLESPFGQWFPSTALGKKLLDSPDVKQLRASGAMIFRELGTTPEALLDDVLGDAVAFAFSPGPPGRPDEERAVILVRPRKVDVLAKLVDRVNDLQTRGGELKAVEKKEHAGAAYFARQKPGGGAEFYCFRGDVFAFSASEADIKAVIDHDLAAPPAATKPPELVARMTKLGVADAAAVLLINPRPLDAEVKAKIAAAKPDGKRFLTRFAEVWTALDSAAVYLDLGANVEVGLALRFHPEKLPADAKAWLTGTRKATLAESLIPDDALVGISGRVRAVELLDLVASIAPVEPGKPGVKEWIGQLLGPVVGRDKLPLVLDALGPNWAVWAEPPAKDGFLPTVVAAVEIGGEGEAREKAEKALLQAVEFGFQTARVAYNANHADQIDVKEEKDADGVVIKSLVNEKGFPPGVRPSFALKKGYLVLATSPDAIRRFDFPIPPPRLDGYATVAKLSGTRSREYLQTHGPKLAKFLADLGAGDEKQVLAVLEGLSGALEMIDSADVIVRGDENGVRIALRVKPAKPVK